MHINKHQLLLIYCSLYTVTWLWQCQTLRLVIKVRQLAIEIFINLFNIIYSKCPDRSMYPFQKIMTDRQTVEPANQPTNGHDGLQKSYNNLITVFYNNAFPDCLMKLYVLSQLISGKFGQLLLMGKLQVMLTWLQMMYRSCK